LVLKKKEPKRNKRRYFDGCREELTGITIPLKYLSCRKKKSGGINDRFWALLSLF
jgi:hypothetical protein